MGPEQPNSTGSNSKAANSSEASVEQSESAEAVESAQQAPAVQSDLASDQVQLPSVQEAGLKAGGIDADIEQRVYLSRQKKKKSNSEVRKTRLESGLTDELRESIAAAPLLQPAPAPEESLHAASEDDISQGTPEQVEEGDTEVERLVFLSRQKRKTDNPELAKTRLDTDALRDFAGKTAEQNIEKLRKQVKEQAALPVKEFKPVSNFRKASPCSSKWGNLSGEGDMRFCEKCQLMVYNFDSVEQPEAERIVCQREGLDKVVLFKRSDGKFLSKNCPVGVARQRLTAGIVLAATVLSLSGGYFLVTQSAQQLVNLGTVASGSSGASADTAPVPGEPDPDGDGAAGGSDASSGARTGLPRANAMLLCAYSRQLAKSLRETYTPPGTIKKDGSKITVQVQISQSGKRIGYHLIESSGHSDIDSYVVKNVLAETYPAPRFHVGNCLPATITFDSKEVAVSIP